MASCQPQIVILEDDDLTDELIGAALMEAEISCPVRSIGTEKGFMDWIAAPDWPLDRCVFVLDLRVRWTRLTPGYTLPPEASTNPGAAGFRCLMALRSRLAHPAAIIYTSQTHDLGTTPEVAELLFETQTKWLVKHEGQVSELVAEVRRKLRAL